MLAQLGREWVPGLVPAANVGATVFPRIERLIHEVEGRPMPLAAAFADDVDERVRKAKPIARPAGNPAPASKAAASTVFDREPEAVAHVLQAAAGTCEVCAAPAPFAKPGGLPYLEVHHLRRLADGGSDTVTNAVACCPNCHRELHYDAERGAVLDGVHGRVGRLIRE